MGYPKIVEDAKGVMNLNFYAYSVWSLSCDFLITRTLKQDDLAAAFSATLLTELEQNYSSGLVTCLDRNCRRKQHEFIRGNSEVFLFC